jgi:hypothetical protein
VIIYKDKVDSSWWRKEGHKLQIVDIEDIVKSKPDALIVGTGAYGVMKVQDEVIKYLKSKGIEIYIYPTSEAVKEFNKLQDKKNIVAALHLTC